MIKILIVGNQVIFKAGLKSELAKSPDFNIVGEADNGNTAVGVAASLQPDVILMAVSMPELDGVAACQKILAQHAPIKIIMLARPDDDSDILAAFAARASGFCLLDATPETVCSAVRVVHAGDTFLEGSVAQQIIRHYTAQGELLPRPSGNLAKASSKPAPPTMEFVKPTVDSLAPRDLEVLRLLVDGLSNQESADKLTLSKAAVNTIIDSILNKVEKDQRTQAAVQTIRRA